MNLRIILDQYPQCLESRAKLSAILRDLYPSERRQINIVLDIYECGIADKIKQLREQNNLLQRQLSAALEIDNGLYSKIERGERRAKREQVVKLAEILKVDQEELLTLWLADQVYTVVKGENNANKVLNVVQENMVEYGKK